MINAACGLTRYIAAAVILVSLAGCASTQEKDTMLNLAQAKTLTQDIERQIAALVPSPIVTATEQRETSTVLFDCERGHLWPGLLTLDLVDGVDKDDVIGGIASGWAGRDGWTLQRELSDSGSPSIVLTGSDGSLFSVYFEQQGRELRVSSYSPCFELGEEVDPGKIY